MKKYPFKFLDAYDRKDRDIFFGRNEEIDGLYEMVFQSKIILIYGASGTGKTSLIQCGLSNKFKPYDWLSLFIRRGTNINVSLNKALVEAGEYEEKKKKNVGSGIQDIGKKIKAAYVQSFLPIYLIFDQLEELFLLGSKKEQKNFIQAVKEILEVDQPVKMILVIREEYLGYLYEFEKEVPQLMRKKLRVEPMNLDKVQQVIHGVANCKDSLVTIKKGDEEALAAGIFDKIKGKEKTLTIELPYLQVFLDKLYLGVTNDTKRASETELAASDLSKIGSIGNVLRDFLEEQASLLQKSLSERWEAMSVDIIWKILSPFATLEGTKEPISKDKIYERLPDMDQKLIDEVVEGFVGARILKHAEQDGFYEIAHDSLAKQIANKRSNEEIALLEVRRLIKSQSILGGQARELFTERQLNFISPYLDKIDLSEEDLQMIDESRRKIEFEKQQEQAKREAELIKERKRRRQATIWAFAGFILAAISIGAGSLALRENRRSVAKAQEAKAIALAAQSRVVYPEDNTIALHLATAAYSIKPTAQSAGALNYIYKNSETNFYSVAFRGHSRAIASATFSPGGEYILTGSNDSTARLWDLHGNEIMRFSGHRDWVTDAIFTPDGQNVLTCSKDSIARLWNLNGEVIRKYIDYDGWVNDASFSSDGAFLLTGTSNKVARLWSISGDLLRSFTGHNGSIESVTFSPDDQYILTGSFDRTAKLWSRDGSLVRTLEGHNHFVHSVAFSPDGRYISTGSMDQTAKLWSVEGAELVTFPGHNGTVQSAAFSPDGEYILTGSVDEAARLWSKSGQMIRKFNGHKDWVHSVAFSPDGQKFVTGSYDGEAKLWNVGYPAKAIYAGHKSDVYAVDVSPDGQFIVTGSRDSTAVLWDIDGTMIHRLNGHADRITSVDYANNGKTLMTGSRDNTAILWDLNGNVVQQFTGHSDWVNSVAIAPDGKSFVTGSKDGTAIVWDASGKQVVRLEDHSGSVYSVNFSNDGSRVLTGGEDQKAIVWNKKGKSILVIDGHEGFVNSAEFSSDGKYIVTGSGDRTAKLWNLEGKQLQAFDGHSDWVNKAIFSPDDQYVLTVSDDKTAVLWSTEGYAIMTYLGHEDFVKSAAFLPDGQGVVTAGSDDKARQWSVWNVFVQSEQIAKLSSEEEKNYSLKTE